MSDEIQAKSSQTPPPVKTEESHPIENIYRFFDDMLADRWMSHPRLFHNTLPGFGLFGAEQPRVDIIDGENEVIVSANLPGVKKEDIDITASENSLTIRATKKNEQEEKKGEYFRREISQGEFSRTLALPAEVNSEGTTAVFSDGVLKLTLPKVRSSKRHSVKIQ